MPRKTQEPEWDSESDDASEGSEESGSSEESGFENEGSSESEESGFENEGSSEEESEEESESEEGSDEEESESGSSEYSSDSGMDESIEEIDFNDESAMWGKESRNSSLMNEPSKKPKWAKMVPSKIMDKGQSAGILFLVCICLIPLAIIIGLSVGLTVGRETEDEINIGDVVAGIFQGGGGVVAPTTPPMGSDAIRATVLSADASNTIHRSGPLTEVSEGGRQTMLVQNGPPGDIERPSAYSLVEFDGIVGVDSDASSVDDYLNSIEGLVVDFCLNVAKAESKMTYSTCLLPSDSSPIAVGDLTGATAPSYSIPGDCLNNEVVTFEVDASTTEACVDIAPLLKNSTMVDEPMPSTPATTPPGRLRGLRRMEKENGFNQTYLFIIDALEESTEPGTYFYSSQDTNGFAPTLSIEGENTCKTFDAVACTRPGFKSLCYLVNKAGVDNVLSLEEQEMLKTVFVPTDDAFANLANETKEALNNTDTLIDTIRYHVSMGLTMSTDLSCGGSVEMLDGMNTTTLCGSNSEVFQVGTGVSPGVNSFPKIAKADVETCFGVVHAIDEVLIPPGDETPACIDGGKGPATIAELCTQSDYTQLCSLLTAAGLVDIFSTGLYTLFAPTDEAFAKALVAFGTEIDFTDTGLVTSVVLQHVISGSAVYSDDLVCDSEVEMANGNTNLVTCENGAFIISGHGNSFNSPPIISETDVDGCNFVIHRVDEVILPFLGSGGNNGTVPEFEPCGICGAGKSVREPDATITVPDNLGFPEQDGDFTCQMADQYCKSGGCSKETCNAFANGLSESCFCADSITVVDLIATDESLSSLANFATIAGLVGTLSTANGITVFAPDNDAFAALSESYPKIGEENWKAHLESLLQYHVLSEPVTSSEITSGLTAETLNGEDVSFFVNKNNRIFVNNNIRIEQADAVADNGVVHTIEAVLFPSWVNKNVAEVVGDSPNLLSLTGFLTQANLAGDLSGNGPFTVFAPTDDAVENALAAFESLTGLSVGFLGDAVNVKTILLEHVVAGMHPAASISDGTELTALSEGKLSLSLDGDTAMVNGIKIVSTDILANNGIIHLIDGLLIPPSLLNGPPGGFNSFDGAMGGDSGAATQACSICSGEVGAFKLNTPDAMLTFPDGVSISTIQGGEATCTLAEQACQFGFCSAETCVALAEVANDTCGCEEL